MSVSVPMCSVFHPHRSMWNLLHMTSTREKTSNILGGFILLGQGQVQVYGHLMSCQSLIVLGKPQSTVTVTYEALTVSKLCKSFYHVTLS